MLIPVSLLTGCSKTTTEEELDDVTDAASESAETLTMFLITEQHVPTKEEVDALKANKGETSAEYIDAKSTMEAYASVAEALDKITKAKFRTQLVTTFYTIEEYVAVEKMIEEEALKKQLKEEAKEALQDFKREKKKDPNYQGYDDKALESLFYEENPKYAQFADAATTTTAGSKTEAETIIDGYGMEQLKYPNVRPNQVDIICVCGYNNYLRYIENGWLQSLDAELEGDSKAILTYVNEKFIKSAMVSGSTYGVPNNMTIGEYTYLLIDKERFDHYEYDLDSIPAGSAAISSEAYLEFLKDIKRYDKDYTPLTGKLEMTNDLFWTLSYEFESVGDAFDSVESFNSDFLYFSKHPDKAETYRLLTLVPDANYTYATVKATAFEGTAFESGVTYYTKTSDGYYDFATEYKEGVTYYTLEFTDIVTEEGKEPFEAFEEKKIYFQKVQNSSVSYLPVYTFAKHTEYFVVLEAEFDYDEFNIFGTVLPPSATNETQVTPNLMNNLLYKNQALAIKIIQENGYYNADAIRYDEATGEYVNVSKYASAIIKGDASLAEKYGDDYYMVVLEYPKANAEELCQNLFAVTSSCKNLSRAMQVITYINTNKEFRNLIQYGIETQNYVLEEKIDSLTGNPYKAVKRLNNYYSMDIYKTGNAFIAYPEEYMSSNIWDYGKKQNSNAVYNPMIEFNLSEYVSQIDFAMVGYFKQLSEKYEAQINACETSEELSALFAKITSELKQDPYFARDNEHGAIVFTTGTASDAKIYNKYGLYNHYMNWWVTTDYFVPEKV